MVATARAKAKELGYDPQIGRVIKCSLKQRCQECKIPLVKGEMITKKAGLGWCHHPGCPQ